LVIVGMWVSSKGIHRRAGFNVRWSPKSFRNGVLRFPTDWQPTVDQ
jgi:hypothetical protein